MDFELTEEQQMIRDAAREFAQSEIAPVAAEFDQSGEFPVDTIRQAGELGFMGIEVPEEYGGAALDSVCYALVIEEISAADAAHGTIRGYGPAGARFLRPGACASLHPPTRRGSP